MNTKENFEINILNDNVIKGGYCIGCGVCASIENSPIDIKMNEYGNIVAELDTSKNNDIDVPVLSICPFSGESKNEDELGEIFFPDVVNKDNKLGKYIECFAGHVVENEFRAKGSSGGMGKWIAATLLKNNEVDYLIQVVPNTTKDSSKPLFDYELFDSTQDVLKGSKSAYYPVELSGVLKKIKETKGTFVITGVPCFIKSLRLLSAQYPEIRKKIKYTIGIVCGGMKSANQSKMIGWQMGVHPDDIVSIDFRRQHSDSSARRKKYQVWSRKDNIERYKNASDIYGTDYGASFFKPQACDFCDDVVSETADISIGDAWLPQYTNDSKGSSLVIVRNKKILEIINNSIDSGELNLDKITKEEAISSQSAGFRHRREALSYRLLKKEKNNEWYPKKRVSAGQFKISKNRKKIYSLREEIAAVSHVSFLNALKKNDLSLFVEETNQYMKKYIKANKLSLIKRVLRKLKIQK